jgi:hypothetical protein
VNAMFHGQIDFSTRTLNLKYRAIQFIFSNAVPSTSNALERDPSTVS